MQNQQSSLFDFSLERLPNFEMNCSLPLQELASEKEQIRKDEKEDDLPSTTDFQLLVQIASSSKGHIEGTSVNMS